MAVVLGAGGSAARPQPCGAAWASLQGVHHPHRATAWQTGEHHHHRPHPDAAEPVGLEALGRRVPCARALTLQGSLAGAVSDDVLRCARAHARPWPTPDHAYAGPQAASVSLLHRRHERHAPNEAHAAERAHGAAPALLQGPGTRQAPDLARLHPDRRLLQIAVVEGSTPGPALLSPATVSALAGVLQLATRAGAAPATDTAAAGMEIASAAVDAATVLASAGLQYVVLHLPATPPPAGGSQATVQNLAGGPGPASGPAAGGASASLAAPTINNGSSSSSWLAGIGAAQAAPPGTTTVSMTGDQSGGSKTATVLIALLPVSCFVLLGALFVACTVCSNLIINELIVLSINLTLNWLAYALQFCT